jgi:hypothetical protein
LTKLAEDYHNTVCKDKQCIIYEKKMPLFKANIEVVGGIVSYYSEVDFNDKNHPNGGILVHVWMPASNEKLYFRSGLLYSSVKIDNKKHNLYKIPLQLEYISQKELSGPKLHLVSMYITLITSLLRSWEGLIYNYPNPCLLASTMTLILSLPANYFLCQKKPFPNHF